MTGFPGAPLARGDLPSQLRQLRDVINNILRGKTNNVTEITLAPNVAQTAIQNPLLTADSFIGLMPQTASAASAVYHIAQATRINGAATITHDVSAATDRTFKIVIIG